MGDDTAGHPGGADRCGDCARPVVRGDRAHDPRAGRRQDHPGRRSTRPSPATWCWCRRASTRRASPSRTDGVVLRGVDRNRTILDGEFKRDNGVFVVGARRRRGREPDRAQLHRERLLLERRARATAARTSPRTATATTACTRTTRSTGPSTTRTRSGSPDSGFYIGQCNPCHAVITDVVSEYNQLGYSGTNSSGRPLPS